MEVANMVANIFKPLKNLIAANLSIKETSLWFKPFSITPYMYICVCVIPLYSGKLNNNLPRTCSLRHEHI